MGGALTSYTPTWTGITTGNGTNAGGWVQFGRTTYFRATFTLGTTSAITGAVTVTLPVTSATSNLTGRFSVGLYDSGGSEYLGASGGVSSTVVSVQAINTAGTYAVNANLSSTIPFTWGNGDAIIVSGWFDATS